MEYQLIGSEPKDMALHERSYIEYYQEDTPDMEITRVPGGWIYRYVTFDDIVIPPIFVPETP